MQNLDLVLLDTNIPEICLEKFKTVILPSILVQHTNINGESFWKVNSDYKHVLKGKNSCILDFVRTSLEWTDVYDVDLFGLQIKRQYDEVKEHINDFINISEAYVECHAIVKTTPIESFMIIIVGKKATDILHIGKKAKIDLDNVLKSLNDVINNLNNTLSGKLVEIDNANKTELKNVGDAVNSRIDRIKAEFKNDLGALTNDINVKLSDADRKLNEFNTGTNVRCVEIECRIGVLTSDTTGKITELNNGLDARCNDIDGKVGNMVVDTNNKLEDVSKRINNTNTNVGNLDNKVNELNSATNNRLDSAVKNAQDVCLMKCQEVILSTDSKLESVKNDLSTMMSQLKTEMTGLFASLNASINDRMARLDNAIQDLETVAFPKGKDFLRI